MYPEFEIPFHLCSVWLTAVTVNERVNQIGLDVVSDGKGSVTPQPSALPPSL